jgi:hypothetical protein
VLEIVCCYFIIGSSHAVGYLPADYYYQHKHNDVIILSYIYKTNALLIWLERTKKEEHTIYKRNALCSTVTFLFFVSSDKLVISACIIYCDICITHHVREPVA